MAATISPRSVSTAAASSGWARPRTTAGWLGTPRRSSARVRVDSPTLAAQPPQSMSPPGIVAAAKSGVIAPSRSSTWKRRTKRRSIQSFNEKRALPSNRHAPLGADGAAVAQVQQREEVALRAIRTKARAADPRRQVVREHRTLADRVDAGLGEAGARRPRRAVAHREDLVVPHALQRRTDAHEAALVGLEPGALEDRQRGGARHPDHRVGGEPIAAFQMHRSALDPRHAGAGADHDPACSGRGLDAGGRARRVARQDAGAGLEQEHFDAPAAPRPQPGREGEGHLDTARARAGHDEARGVAGPRGGQELVHVADELADRARRDRVLADAGQLEPGHRRAHVEGHGVVRDRRPAVQDEAPRSVSRPVAAATMQRAPARRASGRTSISRSSRGYWPATKPGTMPE